MLGKRKMSRRRQQFFTSGPLVAGLSRDRRRALHFETLEERRMLSLSPTSTDGASMISADWFDFVSPRVAALPDGQLLSDQTETVSWHDSEMEMVSGEWIVQLADAALDGIYSVADTITLFADSEIGLAVSKGLGRVGQVLVHTASTPVSEVVAWLEASPLVDYFVPNGVISSAV